jgi:glycosyltransferase involved in cell wall biosynthesis
MAAILIVVGAPDPSLYGGQATVAMTHARLLAQRGHEVHVLTTNLRSLRPPCTEAAGEQVQDNCRIHRLPASVPLPHFSAVRVRGIARWLREHAEGFDVAHVHFAREHLPVRSALELARLGLPFVIQTHGNLHRRRPQHRLFDAVFSRRALRQAARVCALQEVEAARLKAIEPRARIVDLPNGIALPARPSWRPELLQAPVVLFVGRLGPEKRVLDVVEAARRLAAEGLRPRFRIIGGDAGDGAEARDLCVRHGLQEQFDFLGALPHEDVLREMDQAAIYVQPSVRESFSLTTFEAIARGVPAIVTTGNEMSPLFRRQDACVVIDPTAEALAAALGRVLRDTAQAESLSREGRKLAESFSLDAVLSRLEDLYRRVL